MGQAWAESAMRGLPGSHGLSPENHTQRRNAGVGRKFHPGVSFAQDHQCRSRPGQARWRLRQHLAAWPPRQGTLAVFNGQVMPWTTQDSQVPRIGLQCRCFLPIRPKPGQKRHIGESALVGCQAGPSSSSRCPLRCPLWWTRSRHETGLGVHHHYSR